MKSSVPSPDARLTHHDDPHVIFVIELQIAENAGVPLSTVSAIYCRHPRGGVRNARIENLYRVAGLREKYRELFQEEARSRHREHLFRKLVWRLQALAEGGLSERARTRAQEIANDAASTAHWHGTTCRSPERICSASRLVSSSACDCRSCRCTAVRLSSRS
ncbi:MAG: DUF2924 domain-containing protein [Acidobacteriota bacterium]